MQQVSDIDYNTLVLHENEELREELVQVRAKNGVLREAIDLHIAASSVARTDLEVMREALDRARRALAEERQALAIERQISNAARIYIMYTSSAYHGDTEQVELIAKWLEACKKRQGAE